MASRPQRLCLSPGCAQLADGSDYCVHHRKPRRRSLTQPLERDPRNSRSWRRFRAWFLSQNPLCSDCQARGYVTGATDVHHRIALRDGGALYEVANCLALCHPCHSRRTGRGE